MQAKEFLVSFKYFIFSGAEGEARRTKDLLHVMQVLGHRNIQNTLIYTHLAKFESDEYHHAVAKTLDEAGKLVDAGFESVCDFNTEKLFRKRKY